MMSLQQNFLQTKVKFAVVPGTAFGACGEGFLRISYAYSLDDLRIALDRVAEFVTEIRRLRIKNGRVKYCIT